MLSLIRLLFKTLLKVRYRITPLAVTRIFQSRQKYIILSTTPSALSLFLVWVYAFFGPKTAIVIFSSRSRPLVEWLYARIGVVVLPPLPAFPVSYSKNLRSERCLSLFKKWDRLVINMSDELWSQDFQHLAGEKLLYQIAHLDYPDLQSGVIHVNGLWGGIFSKAWTGKSPKTFLNLMFSMVWTVLNGFVALPKRDLVFQYTDITVHLQQKKHHTLDVFNKMFEEQLKKSIHTSAFVLLPHIARWNDLQYHKAPLSIENSYESLALERENIISPDQYGDDLANKIISSLAAFTHTPSHKIHPQTHLILDLNCTYGELDFLTQRIHKHFPLASHAPASVLHTVSDLLRYALGVTPGYESLSAPQFQQKTSLPDEEYGLSALMHSFMKNKRSFEQRYEPLIGQQRKRKSIKEVILMMHALKKFPQTLFVIDIASPHRKALTFLACRLAGKNPILLAQQHLPFESLAQEGITHVLTDRPSKQHQLFAPLHVLSSDQIVARGRDPLHWLRCVFSFVFPPQLVMSQDLFPLIIAQHHEEHEVDLVPVSRRLLQIQGMNYAQMRTRQKNIVCAYLGDHPVIETVLHIFALLRNQPFVTPALFQGDLSIAVLKRLIGHCRITHLMCVQEVVYKLLKNTDPFQSGSLKEILITDGESLDEKIFNLLLNDLPTAHLTTGYVVDACGGLITYGPLKQYRKGFIGDALSGYQIKVFDPTTGYETQDQQTGQLGVSTGSPYPGYLNRSLDSAYVLYEYQQYFKPGCDAYVLPGNKGFAVVPA